MNTMGSYDCACIDGYEGSGFNQDCTGEFLISVIAHYLILAVDVVNIVLHNNDINNSQNPSNNPVQCCKCYCLIQSFNAKKFGTSLTGLRAHKTACQDKSCNHRLSSQDVGVPGQYW